MKESYEESIANDFGLQQWCDDGNNVVLSDCAEEIAGQLLSSEISTSVCRPCLDKGKATSLPPLLARRQRTRRSRRPCACVEILNARTGSSQRPAAKVDGSGQRTFPRVRLT